MDGIKAPQDVFQGGGSVGALMRSLDWSVTPLGVPGDWPGSLQSIVRMMLTSRYQMWMAWGPDLTFLCNDAYCPTLGVKYPWAIGQTARKVWEEIWSEIGPLIDHVLETGEATYSEGMLLFLERSGFREETYHTFSYSPLFDDTGAIAGMFCVVVEETDRVLNERRLGTLRELASAVSATKGEQEMFDIAGRQLAGNDTDLPFTLIYVFDEDKGHARLAASSGIAAGTPFAPRLIDIAEPPWPIARILDGSPSFTLENLGASFGDLPAGAWDKPPDQAFIAPFGQERTQGFMLVGLNPYRLMDRPYSDFVGLLAGQVGAALAASRAYDAERKRAEALAEIDRAKTAFFSNVSHEFRTPLTLMLGPLEDVLTQAGALTPSQTAAQVELAHRNGLRLLRLVNSLLDFSRIEAGRVQARFVPTDLGAFSAEIASTFRSAMEKAGLNLRIEVHPLPRPVYIDREMWEKTLLNLLSNAFKFTFEGTVSLKVHPSADGRTAQVSVADTGIGVAPDQVPRLFERFHRVEGAQGRTIEGSGIGLALVLELVKLHGGRISAESTLGIGTSFTIDLAFGADHLPPDCVHAGDDSQPARQAAAYIEEALRWLPQSDETADATRGPSLTDGSVADMSAGTVSIGNRVLLADDNADMREYVRRLLLAQGYVVEAVTDGEAALAVARERAPDLILSDVMMPRLDGFGLLRALRADVNLAGIPVILLSARAGEAAKVEGLDAGADDYLIKPFGARELLARVSGNIQMARIRREAAREVMRSEQRFIMTNEKLRIALSTGRIAIFDLDTKAGLAIVVGPLAPFFGVLDSEAAEGLPLERFIAGIHPDDRERVAEAIRRSIDFGAPYDIEYRTIGGNTQRRVVARGGLQPTADGPDRFVGAVIDITDEKAIEEALRRHTETLKREVDQRRVAELELQKLNSGLEERVASEVRQRLQAEDILRQAQKMEAVGQLTGGIAHDFNNLLTIIIGGLDTIRRSGPPDNARLTMAVDMATQGARRAATLTARLLAFSRRQPLEPKPLDLNHVVRDSTELLHRTLGETIELEGVLAPHLWTIEVDQNQLESAILNLAVNARDAMPGGGKLTIETANTMLDESYTATDAELVPGQYVVVSIGDNGSGMPREVLDRAFEPFYTTKEVGRGTGLGLSMVYGFVKQSGGHVTIESEAGQGTRVKLYFPRYLGESQDVEVAPETESPQAVAGETILIVEDNDEVRGYSRMVLGDLGYTVLEAANSDAAMAILERPGRIDLLFTDVVLPGRTGRVLADEALKKRPGLNILFTTGYSRDAIVHQGRLDAGIQLIGKPFTFDQLAVTVRRALDKMSAIAEP